MYYIHCHWLVIHTHTHTNTYIHTEMKLQRNYQYIRFFNQMDTKEWNNLWFERCSSYIATPYVTHSWVWPASFMFRHAFLTSGAHFGVHTLLCWAFWRKQSNGEPQTDGEKDSREKKHKSNERKKSKTCTDRISKLIPNHRLQQCIRIFCR